MEADWEIETGGGAPVIEALWAGFVDLRAHPDQIASIAEAVTFPPPGQLLAELNQEDSLLWTSKCDLWEPEPDDLDSVSESVPASLFPPTGNFQLACYVDLLPRQGLVFSQWHEAEELCRAWVRRLNGESPPDCRVDLVIRQAVAGEAEGFAITAYLSAEATSRERAAQRLSEALARFAQSIPKSIPPLTK